MARHDSLLLSKKLTSFLAFRILLSQLHPYPTKQIWRKQKGPSGVPVRPGVWAGQASSFIIMFILVPPNYLSLSVLTI